MSHETRKHIYIAAKLGDRVADWIAAFIGSWLCVFLHVSWFIAWFMLHLDINTLTNAVSLEAIFLCIFLLMSQNRASDRDHVRDDLESVEVGEIYQGHKLLHSLMVEVKEIDERQTVTLQQVESILEALQPKKREAKP